MKMTLCLLALALTTATSPAAAAPSNEPAMPAIAQDIVSAGKLRAQSQRLAKLWLQAGLGIQAGTATGQLARGTAQFDAALAHLKPYATQPTTRRDYARVTELWLEYRIVLALPYNDSNTQTVSYLADDLMLATGRLATRIESEAEGGSGRLLDLSMRQNMLAQRLARLYLLAQAGDRSSGRLVDIDQARKEFATTMRELNDARENTPASREALNLAAMQWMFFDRAISEMKKGNAADSRPQHVATASERITEVLDAVGQQYALDAGNLRFVAASASMRRN